MPCTKEGGMEASRYIAVEGPIGVGKTSLARRLTETFSGRLILEEAADNPMLVDFYKDRVKNAFKTQLFFLLSRYQQQKELIQQDLFSPVVISDYLFAKDRIFASINLSREEQSLYEKVYQLFDVRLPKPDLVLYLHASTDILVKNIKKRGHTYEKGIDAGYI
ncbi:MAG: deoxynucleoside kinase, partial [bacterium]|nr:deoxynucleoside kinase [bacterium]